MAEETLTPATIEGDLRVSSKTFMFIPISSRSRKKAVLELADGRSFSIRKRRNFIRHRIDIREGSDGPILLSLKNRRLLDWNSRYEAINPRGEHFVTFARLGFKTISNDRAKWSILQPDGGELGELEESRLSELAEGGKALATTMQAVGMFGPLSVLGKVGGLLNGILNLSTDVAPYKLRINRSKIAEFRGYRSWSSLGFTANIQEDVKTEDAASDLRLQLVLATAALLTTTESTRKDPGLR